MRSRILLPLLLCCLLAAPDAHARRSSRIAYTVTLTLLATVAWSLLATGIGLRYGSENADTLMGFKRETSASDALIGVGGFLMVPSLMFGLLGGTTFDLSSDRGN